jgi:hypothetical protein
VQSTSKIYLIKKWSNELSSSKYNNWKEIKKIFNLNNNELDIVKSYWKEDNEDSDT